MANPSFETIGKYVLLEKLATGGMAEVFLARAVGTGGISKFFAIKRILPQYADSPEFIDMFREEAKIAINLKHSNITSIQEFGIQDNQFFLVMDFVEGRNLRQILNKMKKANIQFATEHVAYVVREIAAGLDHAHRCIDGTTGKPLNITHRDMSPQNVMVSFDGEVKIVDFGIAKAESQVETTRAGTLKGKFGYMSPEQAEGLPVDMRTDIFSLGIVLWELLANDRLFAANNEVNTLRKIRDCHIPSLRKINPNIHSELERIVHKALAKDKNLRYQSAAALHRDLNRFLNRQYSDYSAHDFSAFIKSIFADEILSLRKKLVDYAKSSTGEVIRQQHNFDDKTVVTATEDGNTSSLIYDSEAGSHDESKKTDEITLGSNSRVEATQAAPSEATLVDRPTEKTDSILSDAILKKAAEADLNIRPKVRESLRENLEPSMSDSDGHTEVEEVSKSKKWEKSNYRSKAPQKTGRKGASPLAYAILLILGFLYLVKFHPGPMSEVIETTRPVLKPVYAMLGVEGQAVRASTQSLEIPSPGQSQSPTSNIEIPAVGASSPAKNVIATSKPSGAEIILNGKRTGLLTPSRIDLPAGKFSLSFMRQGYHTYNMADIDSNSIDRKLDVQLVKARVAYVDMDIIPIQDVKIEVNGVRLEAETLPIRNFAIPANQPVKIKVTGVHGSSAESEVELKDNQKKLLTFRLQLQKSRTPSNK